MDQSRHAEGLSAGITVDVFSRSFLDQIFRQPISIQCCYMHGSMHEHEREFHTQGYSNQRTFIKV